VKIKNLQDFWAGVMFIAFGLFFFVVAQNYEMGTSTRMGPGYFPSILGGLLALLGGILFTLSLKVKGKRVALMHLRPVFFITISLVAFGYLLRPVGLVFALLVLVIISAFGGHEFRLKEVALLSVLLIILSVLVFVKGIGLPFPLWPRFLG
jgi:hypothetical protein